MKKFTLLSISIFLIAFTLKAQYSTPGTGINWNFNDLVANSVGAVTSDADTFYIYEELTISLDDTLRIEQPITVKADSGIEITVLGTWLAHPLEEAVFTSIDTANKFLGFRFEETSSSVFSNCVIEHAGGIQLVYSDMLISDCIIRYFNKENSTGAIDLFHSSPLIRNNEIYHNAGPAVASGATSASSPNIRYNNIYENNTSNANTPQINLGTSGEDTTRIVGNTITGLYDQAGGIAATTLAGGELVCIIDSNLIENNRYGITCYGSNIFSYIRHNEILDNNIANNPITGGSGINFFGSESNVSMVSHNLISGNLWGITIQNTAMPNLGEVEENFVNPGMNEIHGNGNEGEIYDLYNNTPNTIMAENNFWGTNNIDTVEMHIFHEFDDPSLGLVDYMPIYEAYVGTEEIKINQENLIIAIYPTPATESITFNIAKDAELNISSLNGTTIYKGFAEAGKSSIDCSTWPSGIYLLRVNRNGYIESRKILVK